MDGFTLLDIGGTTNGEMKHTVPITAVEITRECRPTVEWNICLHDMLYH